MKYVSALLLILSLAVVSSCKKDTDTIDTTKNPVLDQFTVTGLRDTVIYHDDTVVFNILAKSLNSYHSDITLTAGSLPNGLFVNFSPDKGTPDYASVVTITCAPFTTAGTYPVTITANNTYQTKTFTFNLTVAANRPPSITLNGADSIFVPLFTSFTDPGAAVVDAEDGNISANVVVTGAVETDKVGTYFVKYKITDAGGISDSVSRKVVVSPTAFSITGNNYNTTETSSSSGVTTYTGQVDAGVVGNDFSVAFYNFKNNGSALFTGNISGTTITIPSQTITATGGTISGSGIIENTGTNVTITLNVTYTQGATETITIVYKNF